MWYWRKLGPLFAISFGVGGTISIWCRPWIEAHATSLIGRILLHLAPPALIFLLGLWIIVRMIYWCGAHELRQRVDAQWKERILARIEKQPYHPKFGDILDYVALSEIWWAKMTYRLHLWDWPNED
jgi:hypothetical protein